MTHLGSRLESTERQAGRKHGLLLVSMSCLPVLGAVLLAPLQPQMLEHFSETAGVNALVPLTITAPALMIGLLAFAAGRIADSLGRIRLLTVALVLYSVCGIAPLLLDSLPLIVLSRLGVGIAEAGIMTCCTTLIADYFTGKQRARYFGLQIAFTSLSAVVFIALGGALAQDTWRTPFWLYSVGIVFAVVVPFVLWQPNADTESGTVHSLAWRPLALPLTVTLFGGAVFYTPIVQIPLKLDGVGIDNPGTIGAISAIVAVATAASAFMFGRISDRGPKVLLPRAFGVAGVGLVIVGLAPSAAMVAAGGIVASAGSGMLLPTLLMWVIGELEFAQRARGTGAFTASIFLGQFLSPLVVLAFALALGGLTAALAALGVLAVLTALLLRSSQSVRKLSLQS
ncbi:MAG: MFS transporter [Rhodococcus sp. (in: high G+C Gram-positive bacteria)]